MFRFGKLNKPFIGFIISCLSFYIFWYFIYELWIHKKRWLDNFVIDQLKGIAETILKSLNYELIDYSSFDPSIRTVGIDGSHGVWIGDPCNGIALFAIFTGFIIASPGKLVNKFLFIPLGIFMIHIINGLRVTALALLSYYYPETLEFNHNYTFTIIVYSFVFYLWYVWVKGLNNRKLFK